MCRMSLSFFFIDRATTEIYTLSLHDALPISKKETFSNARWRVFTPGWCSTNATTSTASSTRCGSATSPASARSEEHTSELQSHHDLVCRLLLEKKNA